MHVGLQVLASIFRELDSLTLTAVMQYIDGCTLAGSVNITIALYENATGCESLVDLPTVGMIVPVLWVSSGAVTYDARGFDCQWKIAGVCADHLATTSTHTILGVSK